MGLGRWEKVGRALPRVIALGALGGSLIAAAPALAAVDGDFDQSFSGDGTLVTDFNNGIGASVGDAVVDSSGRLIVAGGDGSEIGVARFNPDGSFDTTFGGDGDVQIDSGATTGGERAVSVAIDPATGNILVLGQATNPSNTDLVLARLLPSGALDTAFDGPDLGNPGNGRFRINFVDDEFPADIIASGDKVVFTASVGTGAAGVARVIQLTSTGVFDTAFGAANGIFDFQFAPSTHSFPNGLARQGDGKLLVSGQPNASATHGVARINTGGSLDTGFNSGGTTPGIARPPLPSGYIDSNALDVVVDANGITVAGSIQKGSPSFDTGAMLSRLTAAGVPDTGFGSSAGFALMPDAADANAFTGLASLASGKLLAGGIAGPIGPPDEREQLLARFTAGGALDTTFSDDGFLRSDVGVPATSVASPVSDDGVAYLTGLGSGSTIAISAVCATVPPACPSPETPDVLMVTPPSGSNNNTPRVFGMVAAGAAVSSVSIYKNATCTGAAAATGTEANFNADGIPVSVPNNSTTTFYAKANGVNGSSACSTSSVTYKEVTRAPPATAPAFTVTGQRAAALKKCKKKAKKKNWSKKRRNKCRKAARKLPV